VGLASEYESEFNSKLGSKAIGNNMNEEEKVPNISKTRINDNSAVNYTNS
jgi:hypothetical protein